MVQRRIGGGAPPTSKAYDRAMEQWQNLPGAVRSVPAADLPRKENPVPPDGNPEMRPARKVKDGEESS